MPDLLHIIPVGDDAVLNGVLQGEDTPLGLGLVSNIGVLLSHTDHDTLVPWATNDGREDSPGGVITGETSLAHAGAIVNDKSSNVFVTHLDSSSVQSSRALVSAAPHLSHVGVDNFNKKVDV